MKIKKVRIKLEKSHTHAGKPYEAGEEIEVSENQAKWLRERGVARTIKNETPISIEDKEE